MIFSEKKAPRGLKVNGYKYIGQHKDYASYHYYVKEYDEYNMDFLEINYQELPKTLIRLPLLGGLYSKKYVMTAGTSVKVLDTFMISYLKNRKVNSNEFDFVGETLKLTNWSDDMKAYFSLCVPKELDNEYEINKWLNKGYEILYVANTENKSRKFGTVTILLVQEIENKVVIFKTLEYFVLPSYVKGEQKAIKYSLEGNTTIGVPMSLLEK
jgi:hypothetical protein